MHARAFPFPPPSASTRARPRWCGQGARTRARPGPGDWARGIQRRWSWTRRRRREQGIDPLRAQHPAQRDEWQAYERGGVVACDRVEERDAERLGLDAPRAVVGRLAVEVGGD